MVGDSVGKQNGSNRFAVRAVATNKAQNSKWSKNIFSYTTRPNDSIETSGKSYKILEHENKTDGSCAYRNQAHNERRFEMDNDRFRRIFSAEANFYCFRTSLIQKFTTGRLAPWNRHCCCAIDGSYSQIARQSRKRASDGGKTARLRANAAGHLFSCVTSQTEKMEDSEVNLKSCAKPLEEGIRRYDAPHDNEVIKQHPRT